MGNHVHRFGQPHVAEDSLSDPGVELVDGESGADLLLKGNPAELGVLNALDNDLADLATDPGNHQRQKIHEEPWIDAGGEDRHAVFPGSPVEIGSDFRLTEPGESQLFTTGNDVLAAGHDLEHLRMDLLQARRRGQDYHLGLQFCESLSRIATDHHPQGLGEPRQVAEVGADLAWIGIDGTDDFERLLFQQILHGAQADGANAKLNDADLFVHGTTPLQACISR